MNKISDQKSSYILFCQEATDLPIFLQPWWLDLVCTEGDWDVALSRDQGGKVRGVMPYYQLRTFGIKISRNPKLTPYHGIWLNYPQNAQKQNSRYAFENKVTQELIHQLPSVAFITQYHPPGFDNGLPFLWSGFELSNAYTYRFRAGTSLEDIRAGMKTSVRNKIEKSGEKLHLSESEDLQEVYRMNQLTFNRQNKKVPYTLDFLQKIDKVLKEKEQRKILIIKDKEENIHAVIYLVWDQKTLYNLALGGDPDLRKSGAIQRLLWESVQIAMQKGLNFDFEGSVIEPIERVFRDFGAERVSYLQTKRYKNRWWKALSVVLKGK